MNADLSYWIERFNISRIVCLDHFLFSNFIALYVITDKISLWHILLVLNYILLMCAHDLNSILYVHCKLLTFYWTDSKRKDKMLKKKIFSLFSRKRPLLWTTPTKDDYHKISVAFIWTMIPSGIRFIMLTLLQRTNGKKWDFFSISNNSDLNALKRHFVFWGRKSMANME